MTLKDSLASAAYQAGGSTKTRQARLGTMRDFDQYCRKNNIQTRHASQIKSRHVAGYVEARRDKLSDRTLQNQLSHLRAAIRAAGGRTMPSNRQLGIDGARRTPARVALTDANYTAARDGLAERGAAGERAALGLQRELGLRAGEAIQSPKSLVTWERQLERGERIHVMHGTKGGRDRYSHPADRERALAAVRDARAAVHRGKLIPGDTLKAARSRYERECAAVGLSGDQAPHAARYAYAQARIAAYQNAGYERREALAATSLDLGHGDGRGRWINQVYGRS